VVFVAKGTRNWASRSVLIQFAVSSRLWRITWKAQAFRCNSLPNDLLCALLSLLQKSTRLSSSKIYAWRILFTSILLARISRRGFNKFNPRIKKTPELVTKYMNICHVTLNCTYLLSILLNGILSLKTLSFALPLIFQCNASLSCCWHKRRWVATALNAAVRIRWPRKPCLVI
jgi:hypothetical protein